MPSVAMIDGRRNSLTRVALKRPVASPTPSSASAPSHSIGADESGVIVYDATTTHIVISAPTDTSKPPTSSALAWPNETRASGKVARRRFPRL